MNPRNRGPSRRVFVATAAGLVGSLGLPLFLPSRVFGKEAPSNRLRVGQIGCGRIARVHDMPGVLNSDLADTVAVCDLDTKRAGLGRELVEQSYQAKQRPAPKVAVYQDYRELLSHPGLDAVVISTPDHWHAIIGIDAVHAGKDVYLQKPASLTIAEGRALSNAVQATGRILQIGSQQRSTVQFRYAAELVRNGRIGELRTV